MLELAGHSGRKGSPDRGPALVLTGGTREHSVTGASTRVSSQVVVVVVVTGAFCCLLSTGCIVTGLFLMLTLGAKQAQRSVALPASYKCDSQVWSLVSSMDAILRTCMGDSGGQHLLNVLC